MSKIWINFALDELKAIREGLTNVPVNSDHKPKTVHGLLSGITSEIDKRERFMSTTYTLSYKHRELVDLWHELDAFSEDYIDGFELPEPLKTLKVRIEQIIPASDRNEPPSVL